MTQLHVAAASAALLEARSLERCDNLGSRDDRERGSRRQSNSGDDRLFAPRRSWRMKPPVIRFGAVGLPQRELFAEDRGFDDLVGAAAREGPA
jgi:hypothetical protein